MKLNSKRVRDLVMEEIPEKLNTIPFSGFKVFKLDSSNIKSWDENPDNLELLSDSEKSCNIKSDRTEEDVLYEILLKYGLDLTLAIEEKIFKERKVFNVGMGSSLFV